MQPQSSHSTFHVQRVIRQKPQLNTCSMRKNIIHMVYFSGSETNHEGNVLRRSLEVFASMFMLQICYKVEYLHALVVLSMLQF